MALFGKKKENKEASCCGEASRPDSKAKAVEKVCCGSSSKGIRNIKILGSGCKSCHQQYENVQSAVKNMGLDAQIEYITDLEKVMAYGIMSTPAIVVDEKVISMGKVLKTADVEKLLG